MVTKVAIDGARDARQLLENAWYEDHTSVSLPIDPVKIARALDVYTYEVDLGTDVSGTLTKQHPDEPPYILIHYLDADTRKRFSVAHEIGHYVRRVNELDVAGEFTYIDFRDGRSSAGTDDDEMYANAFAAELLMPEALVRDLHAKGDSPATMAYVFQVSGEAMSYRLQNLGIGA